MPPLSAQFPQRPIVIRQPQQQRQQDPLASLLPLLLAQQQQQSQAAQLQLQRDIFSGREETAAEQKRFDRSQAARQRTLFKGENLLKDLNTKLENQRRDIGSRFKRDRLAGAKSVKSLIQDTERKFRNFKIRGGDRTRALDAIRQLPDRAFAIIQNQGTVNGKTAATEAVQEALNNLSLQVEDQEFANITEGSLNSFRPISGSVLGGAGALANEDFLENLRRSQTQTVASARDQLQQINDQNTGPSGTFNFKGAERDQRSLVSGLNIPQADFGSLQANFPELSLGDRTEPAFRAAPTRAVGAVGRGTGDFLRSVVGPDNTSSVLSLFGPGRASKAAASVRRNPSTISTGSGIQQTTPAPLFQDPGLTLQDELGALAFPSQGDPSTGFAPPADLPGILTPTSSSDLANEILSQGSLPVEEDIVSRFVREGRLPSSVLDPGGTRANFLPPPDVAPVSQGSDQVLEQLFSLGIF